MECAEYCRVLQSTQSTAQYRGASRSITEHAECRRELRITWIAWTALSTWITADYRRAPRIMRITVDFVYYVDYAEYTDWADYADSYGVLWSAAECRGVSWRAAEDVEYMDHMDCLVVMWSAVESRGLHGLCG